MTICFDCYRQPKSDHGICPHCGKCSHLCLNDCLMARREKNIQKKEIMDKFLYACEDRSDYSMPPKSVVMVPSYRHKTNCEFCGKVFDKIHPFQLFCSKKCGRHVRNVNYRLRHPKARQGSREPEQP